jgi:hypothetical protein
MSLRALTGGQPGSKAMAGRSLTTGKPCGTRVSYGGEARSYACRWMVAAGGTTRSSVGGLHDQLPPEKPPGTEGFDENVSVPNIFCGAATRSMCSTIHPLSRYPFIDRLPHAVCLGLSQRHTARIGGPLTTITYGGGYRRA